MSDVREISEPGEQVYLPRDSWAPAFFAGGVFLAIGGIFSGGFMLPGWCYSVIGIVIVLAAFRNMALEARRDFYRLPRKQQTRGATLPVETLSPPQG